MTGKEAGHLNHESANAAPHVGAVESVWLELLRERERGKAILLISAELEELMNLADRIAVMFEGRIVGILDAASVTQEKLGLMISGVA